MARQWLRRVSTNRPHQTLHHAVLIGSTDVAEVRSEQIVTAKSLETIRKLATTTLEYGLNGVLVLSRTELSAAHRQKKVRATWRLS